MSLLTTLRYLWEGAAAPDPNLEAWVLGVRYAPAPEWAPEMLADVRSRLWLMYRTAFPLIPRHPEGPSPLQLSVLLRGSPIDMHGFISDIGWGCMIRTGQCLVANGLLHLALGRAWRADAAADAPADAPAAARSHREIVTLFADTPEAPLSIHNFVAQGIPRGKLPGQWFGPSTVAQCIKQLCHVPVYVSEGMDVYTDQLRQWPLLVLCPVRLGISEINAVYAAGVKACLTSKFSIGIAGGRTSASHYFYGFQGDTLFFHDPHVPRPALEMADPDLESVHTDRMRSMPLSEMDPSMLVGFLLRDSADLEAWRAEMEVVPARSRIVVLARQRPIDPSDDELDGFVAVEHDQERSECECECECTCGLAGGRASGPGPGAGDLEDEDDSEYLDEPGEPGEPTPAHARRPRSRRSSEVLVSTPQVADESSVII